jgi:hypothetical protein
MRKIYLIVLVSLTILTAVSAQRPNWDLIPFRSGKLWGYASPEKQIVIKPMYDDAKLFHEGYAAVKKNGKFGYINTTGKLVIPYKYLVAKPFRYGYTYLKGKPASDTILFAGASVRKDGYEICINTSGATLYKCPAIKEGNTNEGFKKQTVTEKVYSDISNNGQLYDKIVDDYAIQNSPDKFYIASKNNLFGVFNNRFEVIVPFKYKSIATLKNNNSNYLKVADETGMVGLLNGDGSVALENAYNLIELEKMNDGSTNLLAKKADQYTILDNSMKPILNGNYKDIMYNKNNGYTLVNMDGNKGFYFAKSGITIPATYADIETFVDDKYIRVIDATGKSGYINDAGISFFEN